MSTDIVIAVDQRCLYSNGIVLNSCADRRGMVHDIVASVFEQGMTNIALVTLECRNPIEHIDFTNSVQNDKTAFLNFINDDSQFPICMSEHMDQNCVTSCGVGLDTALNCFENNASPNNRKVLVFISFCECEGQGTDSICNRQTELEEQGIQVIVANIDIDENNAVCVDSDGNTISSQSGITETVTKQIVSNICEGTPSPTQQQETTTTVAETTTMSPTQGTTEEITTMEPTTTTTTTATPTTIPTTPSPTYGLL